MNNKQLKEEEEFIDIYANNVLDTSLRFIRGEITEEKRNEFWRIDGEGIKHAIWQEKKESTNTALDRALEAIAAKGNEYAKRYEKEDPLSDESSDLAMGMAICVELHKTIESLKEEL